MLTKMGNWLFFVHDIFYNRRCVFVGYMKMVIFLKKFIALILCAAVCFSFTACSSLFDNEETTQPTTAVPEELPVSGVEGAFKFDEYSDRVVLTQYIGKSAEVFIPDTIKGKPVTGFGTIFKGNMNIVSLHIGNNCREIVENAFTDCYNLRRVQIDAGIKSIGKLAFYRCQALKLAYIPACVEHIEDDAFKYCTDLIIYGAPGSEAERFASNFKSIYFRDLEQIKSEGTTNAVAGATVEETTAVTETVPVSESVLAEELSVLQYVADGTLTDMS